MFAPVIHRLKTHLAYVLLATVIIVHLAMMGSLFWGYLNPLFHDSDTLIQGMDFFDIYEAGHRALENVSVYAVTPYYAVYRYVPAFAYAFAVPANVLPMRSAYWAWVGVYELLLVLNAYATWRVAGRGKWAAVAAGMWFLFTPFYLEQYMGQFSFLMATALFWTGIGIARGREVIAGPPWAASVIVKTNSALLLPLFVRLRWTRSLVGAAALVALNIPYFVLRPGDLEAFYKLNFRLSQTGFRPLLYYPGEQGLVALVRNALMAGDPNSQGMPGRYVVAVAIVVVGLSLLATFLFPKGDPLALFAIWLSVYFLIYAVEEHHYVMYLPVLVLLVGLRPAHRWWALAAFALIALPAPYWLLNHVWNTGPVPMNVLPVYQDAWPRWGVILHHAMKPVPVLALWAYLVVSQLKSGAAAIQPSLPRTT
jgi:hypothetical protein